MKHLSQLLAILWCFVLLPTASAEISPLFDNYNLCDIFITGQKTKISNTFETTFSCVSAKDKSSSIENDALSLDLTSFKGRIENESIILEWETENERGMDRFVIEFSKDNRLFSEVGFVSAENSELYENYTFTDINKFFPKTYYRLKMVGIDGSFEYSSTVLLEENDDSEWFVFPNPASGDILNVHALYPVSSCDYAIFDVQGRQISEGRFEANVRVQTFIIPIQNIISGIYFVEIIAEGKRSFIRFVG